MTVKIDNTEPNVFPVVGAGVIIEKGGWGRH
jgi:hypothetical protein